MKVTIYECDRCGARSEGHEAFCFSLFSHKARVRPDGVDTFSTEEAWKDVEVDLCADCTAGALGRFLDQMGPEEQAKWRMDWVLKKPTPKI